MGYIGVDSRVDIQISLTSRGDYSLNYGAYYQHGTTPMVPFGVLVWPS